MKRHQLLSLNFLVHASLILLSATATWAADVAGVWKAGFDTQVGPQKYVFDIKSDAGVISGKATGEVRGEKREVRLTEVQFKDDVLTFVELLEFEGTPLRIAYSGKVVGDEIRFTRTVGDVATEELVAHREKAEAPRTPPGST